MTIPPLSPTTEELLPPPWRVHPITHDYPSRLATLRLEHVVTLPAGAQQLIDNLVLPGERRVLATYRTP